MPITQHIVLPNNLAALATLAEAVNEFAYHAKLEERIHFNLNLVLDELITNIIQYAYDDQQVHEIHVHLHYAAPYLQVQLIDDGKAFDPTQQAVPSLDSALEERHIGGLGLHFVSTLMDTVAYQRHDNHNHLHLEKTLG